MIRIYYTESMEGNEGEFRKRIVLPYFLVVLVTECNFDLSSGQTMTEAKHNRPIPKLFDNRPSASAAEVFCEIIGLVI